MPWFFAIPEFLKKRACRYLLQHYLGQFLEERISLDDLTVDLYNGTGTINNVPLNVEVCSDKVAKCTYSYSVGNRDSYKFFFVAIGYQ